MASVFKRGRKWYARYRAADGTWKKEAGFSDKSSTWQLAVRLERQADLVRKGLVETAAEERGIADDIRAFRDSLSNKDVSEDQIDLVVGRCQRLIDGCGFETSMRIEAAAVERWLARQRREGQGRGGDGLSVQTSNHYLRAAKQFTRWLYRNKRLREDPLTHLDMLNIEVDRRHDRRALTDDEVSKILAATLTGGSIFGFEPVDRHMLYVVALSTGLRASELASLKPESLQLLQNPPTVSVRAGYSKRRRKDVLPLPTDILDALRLWLAEKPAGQPLWPGPWAENRYAGKMLQVDLKAAGVPYKNAEGLFADFHAIRHTFVTNLARHGVPLTTAQKLARHSTPVLTAARYTHIELAEQHREVEKLPALKLGRDLGQTADAACQNAADPGVSEEPTSRPMGPSEGQENPGKRRRSGRIEAVGRGAVGRTSRPVH